MRKEEALNLLLRLSQAYGEDPLLVQGAGGNASIKTENGGMLVKSSGRELKNVSVDSGWVEIPFADVRALISDGPVASQWNPIDDDNLVASIDSLTVARKPGEKASIEAAMHAVLDEVVVHVHPLQVNVLLCALEGRAVCEKILNGLSYIWIPALPPGYYLAKAIKHAISNFGTRPRMILLENHGVIVQGKTESDILLGYDQILSRVRNWIIAQGVKDWEFKTDGWESEIVELDLFPDTVVFHKLATGIDLVPENKRLGIIETFAASKMIRGLQRLCGLNGSPLPKETCDYILKMSREKHRQNETMR